MDPKMLQEDDSGAILVRLKAVPGARDDKIVGRLGDRLKVRVSAPPEAGKANKAICDLLAKALRVKSRQVRITSGRSSPNKVARITGVTIRHARSVLHM
jgi:uncharacterized protein (TIGR00251 family)